MSLQKRCLYKIVYDDESRRQVEPPFIPLDNTDGRKDWFELYPILNFLEQTQLEDDVWYGFLSPKFPGKAGLSVPDMEALLHAHPEAGLTPVSPDIQAVVV